MILVIGRKPLNNPQMRMTFDSNVAGRAKIALLACYWGTSKDPCIIGRLSFFGKKIAVYY
jgi:hypothetical protein